MTLVDFQTAVNAMFITYTPNVGGTIASIEIWRRLDNLDDSLGIPNSEIDNHITAWIAEVGSTLVKIDHDLYIKTQNV